MHVKNFLWASETDPQVSILASFFTKALSPLVISTASFAIAVQISFPPAPTISLSFRGLRYLFSDIHTSLISDRELFLRQASACHVSEEELDSPPDTSSFLSIFFLNDFLLDDDAVSFFLFFLATFSSNHSSV